MYHSPRVPRSNGIVLVKFGDLSLAQILVTKVAKMSSVPPIQRITSWETMIPVTVMKETIPTREEKNSPGKICPVGFGVTTSGALAAQLCKSFSFENSHVYR